ncbi:MAG: hypothetical protein ACYS26_22175 [Planctomycetota bacterium]
MSQKKEPFDIATFSPVISNRAKIPQSPDDLEYRAKKGLKFLKTKLEKENFEEFKASLDDLNPNDYDKAAKEFAEKAGVKAMDMSYLFTFRNIIKGESEATQSKLMKLWTKAMYTIVKKAEELDRPLEFKDFSTPNDFGVEKFQLAVIHGGGGKHYNGWTRGETVPVGNVMKYI